MKAREVKLLEFLKKAPQFIIPIYQRTYSWTERECHQLWEDILQAGNNDAISALFIGSIVYIEEGLNQIALQSPVLVIDGQQRLTTVSLILEALARHLGETEPVDGFSARKIRNYYLLNPEEERERRFKLLLTQTDKDTLLSLMQQKTLPNDASFRVKENFNYFDEQIRLLGGNLSSLCNGLAKLVIVDISLTREQDNPQLIFESMNSTGRELSQADLIRNFILMGLQPRHQEQLYKDHWRPMEVDFGQQAYGNHFDGFMRHYLTLKTGDIPNVNQVYEAFKNYALPEIAQKSVDSLVQDIQIFASHYCAMALSKEPDRELADAFQDLREFKVDVSYPFLLELYHDYRQGTFSRADFLTALRLVEAYVFRRAICNIPTNSLNKTFVAFGKALNKERYLESIQAYLLTLPSYRRFPQNEEFKRELKTRDLYNFPRRNYWLRRIENHGRKERVPVADYTIEHIMPQNDNLSEEWRTALGNDRWQQVHEEWLHTLGNLTLTGYNSEYSDRPFAEKRDMEGGFRDSPLRLNEGLAHVEVWNETAIHNRAEQLAKLATTIWAAPNLPTEVLATYNPAVPAQAQYTIDDHSYLAADSLARRLFDALRQEILALDPVVTEEFLKLYIAYKAETNFVDVIPLAGSLRLLLNMAFHEINDPKGMCRDVTNIGRWGNGDVEIRLSDAKDLPYVLGLVRQSFEKQMGISVGTD